MHLLRKSFGIAWARLELKLRSWFRSFFNLWFAYYVKPWHEAGQRISFCVPYIR